MHVTPSDDPRNAIVLAHLKRRGDLLQPWAEATSVDQPYLRCGCHPDIVARVWDELGAASATAARGLVHGTPALVHASSGIILATGLGTEYALRVPDGRVDSAIAMGVRTQVRWSNGELLDARSLLGPGWFIGTWLHEEIQWCAELAQELDQPHTAS